MKVDIIPIPRVFDERGALAFAESDTTIPFTIRRVFWIYDIPSKAQRGGHAHWQCSEVVIPISGAFTMLLDDGKEKRKVRMSSPDEGILVPAGVWCELKDFSPNTILLVLASHPYDPQGYEHDYNQYLKITNPQ